MDTVDAFLKVLDPADNSTGGGTASALAGAMAASLASMVARLSVGKAAGAVDSFYQELAAAGEKLSLELQAGAARDAEAFDGVKAAYRLPKDTPEQTAARSAAIQAAVIDAARVPLANAGMCARALDLARLLEGRSNPNARSDLQCAIYLARAGLAGCLANVAINLPSIKDPATAGAIAEHAHALHSLVEPVTPSADPHGRSEK
jgi:formiminotetrahydrofolate cyclodeaminase